MSVAASGATVVAALVAVATLLLSVNWARQQLLAAQSQLESARNEWSASLLEKDAAIMISLYRDYIKMNDRVAAADRLYSMSAYERDNGLNENEIYEKIVSINAFLINVGDDARFGSVSQNILNARIEYLKELANQNEFVPGLRSHVDMSLEVANHFDWIADRRNTVMARLVELHDCLVDDFEKSNGASLNKLSNDPKIREMLDEALALREQAQ